MVSAGGPSVHHGLLNGGGGDTTGATITEIIDQPDQQQHRQDNGRGGGGGHHPGHDGRHQGHQCQTEVSRSHPGDVITHPHDQTDVRNQLNNGLHPPHESSYPSL